jgi:hypothetical protein
MQMQQRLTAMQQQILSRGSLNELILRPALDLYPRERLKYPMEDIIQDMRLKAIRIQMMEVQSPGQGRVTSAFTISFRYPNRFKAQQVVRELVTFGENKKAAREADTASGFIGESLKTAKDKMDALAVQISQFQGQNMGKLPECFRPTGATAKLQMQLSNTNEGPSRLQQQKMQPEAFQNATTQYTTSR